MRIPAIALLASVALAAAPAVARQTMSGTYERSYGGSFRSAENPSLRWGKHTPRELSRAQIKKIQAGLDRAGFNAGPVNGRWGPRTQRAAMDFLRSRKRSSVAELTNRDLAELGLNRRMFVRGGRFYGQARGAAHR